MSVDRRTPDLAGYPELVVVYLGMRVRKPKGFSDYLQILHAPEFRLPREHLYGAPAATGGAIAGRILSVRPKAQRSL